MNILERLEKAAKGVQRARGIEVRVVNPPMSGCSYVEVCGANVLRELSISEATAWSAFFGAVTSQDVLALVNLARVAREHAVMVPEVAEALLLLVGEEVAGEPAADVVAREDHQREAEASELDGGEEG